MKNPKTTETFIRPIILSYSSSSILNTIAIKQYPVNKTSIKKACTEYITNESSDDKLS